MKLEQLSNLSNQVVTSTDQPKTVVEAKSSEKLSFNDDDDLAQAKRDFAMEQLKKSKHHQHTAHKIHHFD